VCFALSLSFSLYSFLLPHVQDKQIVNFWVVYIAKDKEVCIFVNAFASYPFNLLLRFSYLRECSSKNANSNSNIILIIMSVVLFGISLHCRQDQRH
jgi:hypothetical protein